MIRQGQSSDSRRESVLGFARRYDADPAHSRQVARLALRIFDQTMPLHQLDHGARELLECACLLHDIGWSGGESKHKRRSYEIIKSGSLDGFSDDQREIIASVARYHGSKPPRERHAWNQTLSPEDKRKVRYLSAIIRIADALDRSHTGVVQDVECSIGGKRPRGREGSPGGRSQPLEGNCPQRGYRALPAIESDRIILKLNASRHPDAEVLAVRRKKDYFEDVFRCRLELA